MGLLRYFGSKVNSAAVCRIMKTADITARNMIDRKSILNISVFLLQELNTTCMYSVERGGGTIQEKMLMACSYLILSFVLSFSSNKINLSIYVSA